MIELLRSYNCHELARPAWMFVVQGMASCHRSHPSCAQAARSPLRPAPPRKQVALLRVIRHRNVLQFIGACFVSPAGGAAGAGPTAAQQGAGAGPEQEAEALLVTEFMERGDLWRLLPLRNTAGGDEGRV